MLAATNGSTSLDAIPRAPGGMDKRTGDPGAIIIPTVQSTCTYSLSLQNLTSGHSILVCKFWRNSFRRDGNRYRTARGKVRSLRNLTRSVRIMLISHIGIRNFVVGITVKIASDETSLRREKTYINKLNLALVQVRDPSMHA